MPKRGHLIGHCLPQGSPRLVAAGVEVKKSESTQSLFLKKMHVGGIRELPPVLILWLVTATAGTGSATVQHHLTPTLRVNQRTALGCYGSRHTNHKLQARRRVCSASSSKGASCPIPRFAPVTRIRFCSLVSVGRQWTSLRGLW